MKDKINLIFVGLDVSKGILAVSVADEGRDGEVRDWGTVSTTPNQLKGCSKSWHRGPIGLKFAMKRDQQGTGCIGRLRHLVSAAAWWLHP